MIPVGTILEFGGDIAPVGYLTCDGAEFDRADYANLFAVIGVKFGAGNGISTANLPDSRKRVAVGRDASESAYDTVGKMGGLAEVELSLAEMPVHSHVQNGHTHTQNPHSHTQDPHSHSLSPHTHTQNPHSHTQDPHTHVLDGGVNGAAGTVTRGMIIQGGGSNNTVSRQTTPLIQDAIAINLTALSTTNTNTPTNQNTTPTNVISTATNQDSGGGQAHDNMPPFLVLNYIIKY